MQSIRSRAIELAENPANFETHGPVQECDDPASAKLEADAHLAVIIDGTAHRLAESDRLQSQAQRHFKGTLKQKYAKGTPNSEINLEFAIYAFQLAYDNQYPENPIVAESFNSPFGIRAIAACRQFAALAGASQYHGQKVGPDNVDRFIAYEHPDWLVGNGIATVGGVVGTSVLDLYNASIQPEEAENYLVRKERQVRGLASTTLTQFVRSHSEAMYDASRFSIERQLEIARALPKFKSDSDEAVTPHMGCPAMPDYPVKEMLIGGSGVSKLYQRGIKFILSANLHAIRSDDPIYAMLPKNVLSNWLSVHLRKGQLLDKV